MKPSDQVHLQSGNSIDSRLRRDFLAIAGGLAAAVLADPAMATVALKSPISSTMPTGAPEHLNATVWAALMERMKHIDQLASMLPRPDDPILRERLYQHTLQVLSVGYLLVFESNPDTPNFVPLQNNMITTAAPNPDTMYYLNSISGSAVYRLSGYRGTTTFADVQLGYARPGAGFPGRRVSNYQLDDLVIDSDGYFELVLSPERPAGYGGNWRPITDPNVGHLAVRSVSRDWRKETDPRLSLERLDLPPRQSTRRVESLASKAMRLGQFVEDWTRLFVGAQAALPRQNGLINRFDEMSIPNIGGLGKQFYYLGGYTLEQGKALVIETEVPKKVKYWNMQLADELFMSPDFADIQCSLNDFQARVDGDGKFRAVVSLEDPGVPNWLDPGGVPKGLMLGRWYDTDSTPMPTVKVISIADLRQHLPSDTPIVSAREREISLRRRREAANLRRHW